MLEHWVLAIPVGTGLIFLLLTACTDRADEPLDSLKAHVFDLLCPFRKSAMNITRCVPSCAVYSKRAACRQSRTPEIFNIASPERHCRAA